MCGINILHGEPARGERGRASLETMNRALAHRGPDGVGSWTSADGATRMGHLRLAILDLSPEGNQPLANEDGTVTIVFNGEIYNYQSLRAELIAKGHRFRGRSDTEVLVHLWEEEGDAMLARLNGMYAFALHDARTRTLFLARDEAGVKPLYLWEGPGGALAASSELKGLLALPEVPRDLDMAALSDALALQFIPDPMTPFRAVRRLAPGHSLTIKDGRRTLRRFWTGFPPARGGHAPLGPRAAARALRGALAEAVRRQMVSDRPIGAFLSGGVDSSAVVAAMARARREAGLRSPVRCYTVGYAREESAQDPFDEDLPHARRVAAALGADLTALEVRSDASAHWPALVRALDEPIADPAAINAYLIARRAREDGTVVLLSGQGADELFGGYRRHTAGRLLAALDILPGPARRALSAVGRAIPGARPGHAGALLRRARKALEAIGGGFDERFLALTLAQPLDRLARVMGPALREGVRGRDPLESGRALLSEVQGADPVDRMLYRDLKTYLPAQNLHYTDRVTMASGVEARVPFLDRDVLALALSLAPGTKLRGLTGTKEVLREAVRPWLPPEVLSRPKTGFGVPLRGWLRGGLRPLLDDVLSRASVERRGLLDAAEVGRQRRAFETGAEDTAYALFAYATMELWCRAFVDGKAPTP